MSILLRLLVGVWTHCKEVWKPEIPQFFIKSEITKITSLFRFEDFSVNPWKILFDGSNPLMANLLIRYHIFTFLHCAKFLLLTKIIYPNNFIKRFNFSFWLYLLTELGTFVLDTHTPDSLILISTVGSFYLKIST